MDASNLCLYRKKRWTSSEGIKFAHQYSIKNNFQAYLVQACKPFKINISAFDRLFFTHSFFNLFLLGRELEDREDLEPEKKIADYSITYERETLFLTWKNCDVVIVRSMVGKVL